MRGLRSLLPGGAVRAAVLRSRTRRLCVRAASSTAPTSPPSAASCSPRDLRMWNSLTGRTEPLPRETAATPNVLKWYACGPTVYDRAHLGHARAYVSQDILRRVAERTGGYNVLLVMGVTDVDDKIIARAAERGLPFQQLAREQERTFFEDLARLYVRPPTAVTRVSEHMDEIVAYVAEIERQGFAYEASDGSGVYFHTQQLGDAYGKLDPRRQAQAAHSDFTTGSETVDEDAVALAEAEAEADAVGTDTQIKRDPRDFALWKAPKSADEPAWPSPWGPGRPGWHIECSAMTHHVLGDTLDVHTGGVDLRFPHHNNEIAQCEAHNCVHNNHSQSGGEWCRHFVHFGHLYIKGRKMSKSLKNFISVRDFLDEGHTADHFRLFCLQFKYRANLHYSPDRVRDAEAVADRIRSFFRSVSAYGDAQQLASSAPDSSTIDIKSKRCKTEDLEMLTALTATRAQVDAALLDDLDTPKALTLVLELLSKTNAYLLASRSDSETSEAPEEVLQALSGYVLEVLDLFGLEGLHAEFSTMMRRRFGMSSTIQEQQPEAQSNDVASPEEQEALLHALVKFRAAVRETALLDPKQPGNARVLALCDELRNKELPPLGVQVEDLAPGRSVVKRLTQTEREALAAEEAEVKAAEEAKASALSEKQREFEALMQIAPSELFRESPEFTGRFDSFDAEGFPTHENGEPLTKSQRKKLLKKLQKHDKSYNKYWKSKNSTQ